MNAKIEAIGEERLHHEARFAGGWSFRRRLCSYIVVERVQSFGISKEAIISDVICPGNQEFQGGVGDGKAPAGGLGDRHDFVRARGLDRGYVKGLSE